MYTSTCTKYCSTTVVLLYLYSTSCTAVTSISIERFIFVTAVAYYLSTLYSSFSQCILLLRSTVLLGVATTVRILAFANTTGSAAGRRTAITSTTTTTTTTSSPVVSDCSETEDHEVDDEERDDG